MFAFLRPSRFLNCILVMQEVKNKHEILSSLSTSTFEDGLKRFESAVAVILVFVQIASPILPLGAWNSWSISPAEAVLYSPDTKVPRTGELALRKAIPSNTNMKAIQVIFKHFVFLQLHSLVNDRFRYVLPSFRILWKTFHTY